MEVLQRTANRGSISTGFDIANSVKFEADNTEYMKFTSSQSGSDLYRMAFNIWLKRTELGTAQTFMLLGNGGSNSTRLDLSFDSSDRLQVRNVNSNWRLTTQVFRDTSAWYHLFFQIDTTQSTADDRIKIWVNGNLIAIADYTTVQDPGLNAVLGFNRNYSNILGGREIEGSNSQMFSGYIAQVYGSGGTPPSVTDFGEFDEDTGIWKPKDISGISPPDSVNGFFLDFTDASDLGNDASGNGNNFTENNITAADQATDTPTNNFATGNNLAVFSNPSTLVLTEGQTKIAKTANGWETLSSTIAVTSGKWYMEMQNISVPENAMMSVFPADIEFLSQGGQVNNYAGKVSGDGGISYYAYSGYIFQNAGNSSYGTAWANETNTMAIALDMDNGKVYFARANTWQNSGDPTSGATGTGAIDLIEPSKPHMMGYGIYANSRSGAVNFGGYTLSSISSAASDANGYGTFEYAPPSGYYALCTKNLSEYG